MTKQDSELRRRSGEVDSADPLVGLLYDLILRGHMSPGVLETLTHENTDSLANPGLVCHYSNGFVARYAQDIAYRLRPHDGAQVAASSEAEPADPNQKNADLERRLAAVESFAKDTVLSMAAKHGELIKEEERADAAEQVLEDIKAKLSSTLSRLDAAIDELNRCWALAAGCGDGGGPVYAEAGQALKAVAELVQRNSLLEESVRAADGQIDKMRRTSAK